MVTKGRLAEEILLLLSGGRIGNATKYHPNEIKISLCQVCNQLLKLEYMNTLPLGDMIPNGAAIATYENILVTQWSNTSRITLPALPLRLPRNMGVYQIFSQSDYFSEFIPLQLGEASLIRSQGLVSNLSGYIGYETAGMDVIFTQDVTIPNTPVYLTVRLVILDFSQYGDYDPLPIPPEMEWQIKQEVLKLYSIEKVPDKLVEPLVKEGNVPTTEQHQA